MEKFRKCFKLITYTYVIVVLLLIFAYGFFVKGGSWGSLSDVVIAIFTVLIAYTTNMLLVVGWLTSNSWMDQSKHDSAKELHYSLTKLYFMAHEIKTKSIDLNFVKSFDMLTAANYHKLSSKAKIIFQDTPTNLTHDQLADYLNYIKPIFKEASEKMQKQLLLDSGEINKFKFEVMTNSSPFTQGIEKSKIDLIGKVNEIIAMESDFHDTAKPLFDSLKVATGYDGFKLIYIPDPVPGKLFNNV